MHGFYDGSRWIAFAKKHLEKELSHKLLIEKLEALDRVWSTSTPTRDEASYLMPFFVKYELNTI